MGKIGQNKIFISASPAKKKSCGYKCQELVKNAKDQMNG